MTFQLTSTDAMNSVLNQMAVDGQCQRQSFSPYGGSPTALAHTPGFNGERRDPLTGTTHLGNGYRAYNPALLRFHCPDNMSPFGDGGINCYAYCSGDPINNSDPSGHMNRLTRGGKRPNLVGIMAAEIPGGDMAITVVRGMAALSIEDIAGTASRAMSGATRKAPHKNNRKTIRDIGAVSRPKESDSDRMENALKYIDNSKNFEHSIEPGGIISSIDKVNDSYFYNTYTPDEWYFSINQRASGSPYYASDVAAYQYGRVSRSQDFVGKLPKKITRQEVTNQTTLMSTFNLQGNALFDVFFKDTPNGKSTQRIMNNFSLKARSVERVELENYSSDVMCDFVVSILQ